MGEFVEFIFLILGLLGIVFVLYFLLTAASKLFNVNIVGRTGKPIVRPEYFDDIVQSTKSISRTTVNLGKNTGKKFKTMIKKSSKTKIELLHELNSLRDKGAINHKEFEELKAEILNKS